MSVLVELDGVVKRYPGEGARVNAVDGVSFRCAEGRVLALLGPNGAGKSTCIDMIAGLKRPTSGTVRSLGVDPYESRSVIQQGVGVQPQHADVFENVTVQEIFELWASLYRNAATAAEMIDLFDLGGSAKMRVKKLSGGQRQRVIVGLALVSRPRLVVLDEPTSGLDPNAREDLWSVLKERREGGTTILLSTHNMEEAEQIADDVVILSEGTVAASGSLQDLIRSHGRSDTVTLTVPAGTRLDGLGSFPGVREVSVEHVGNECRVTLMTDGDVFRVADIVGELPVSAMTMNDGSLASVFSRVTRATSEQASLAAKGA